MRSGSRKDGKTLEKSVDCEAAVLVGRLDGATETMTRTEWRANPTMSDGEDGEMTGKGVR